jgi:hypothetical protein
VLVPVKVRPHDEAADDLQVETLYDDATIVAAAAHSKWTRRRKIDLAELIGEPWILVGPSSPEMRDGNPARFRTILDPIREGLAVLALRQT